ncbi:MAG: GIY-YIG nuclease family protein [Sphingomonas sp.]|jgi:putative endonuclease|nr:GIY-YIG nuclease family protein [Sphingomonas sp.]
MHREPCVYILARASHSTFYAGVTSNLLQRILQHRTGAFGGFTARWGIKRLVWFEVHDSMDSAIWCEKQIKRWRRQWKYDLIAKSNPTWRDLADDFGFEPLPLGGKRQAPAQGRGDG